MGPTCFFFPLSVSRISLLRWLLFPPTKIKIRVYLGNFNRLIFSTYLNWQNTPLNLLELHPTPYSQSNFTIQFFNSPSWLLRHVRPPENSEGRSVPSQLQLRWTQNRLWISLQLAPLSLPWPLPLLHPHPLRPHPIPQF